MRVFLAEPLPVQADRRIDQVVGDDVVGSIEGAATQLLSPVVPRPQVTGLQGRDDPGHNLGCDMSEEARGVQSNLSMPPIAVGDSLRALADAVCLCTKRPERELRLEEP